MKILREKAFTSRRTKQLRDSLMLRDLQGANQEITSVDVFAKPGKGAGYSFEGKTSSGWGALDRKGAHKMGIDPSLIGQNRSLTQEEIKRINDKSMLDAVKRGQRRANKSWLGEEPDKLRQKELNKYQSVTLDNKTGQEVGRSQYVSKTMKSDIDRANEIYNNGTGNLREVSAFDKERQDALRKFRQDKADKQAKLLAEKSKASVEKHKGQAEEIRKNNRLGVAVRDAKRWVKKNPGATAAIAGGVAAVGAGLGYAAYKHNKNKKNKEK